MICYVYKRKGRRTWRGRYRLAGQLKLTEVPLETTDKQDAQKRLKDLVRELEQEHAGIIAPKPLRDAAQAKLQQHLADYTRDLAKLGRDDMYVYNVEKLVARLLTECQWIYPKDVTPDSFQTWRGTQNKAAKTLNEYLNTMGAFFNWMVANGRLLVNSLSNVKRVETRGQEKRKRRALTHDEASRLLAVAGRWRIVYLAALFTGLRRSELAQMIWGNAHLDSPKPFLYAPASITKNHQEAVIWLHEELAGALRAHRPAMATTADAIFPAMPSMYRLKAHLCAARIPYIDVQGRQADLHALRHTFGTNLSLAGVAPRLAMELMRHSDLRLTMKIYTDASRLPTAAAIDSLPGFAKSGPHIGPQELGAGSHDVTRDGTGKDHQSTGET